MLNLKGELLKFPHDPKSWTNFYATWRPILNNYLTSNLNVSLKVMWDNYCGCLGFNIETTNYVHAIDNKVPIYLNAAGNCICPGFPAGITESIDRIRQKYYDKIDVLVCHKPPSALPDYPNQLFKSRPSYVIARSMYESSRIPPNWAQSANSKCDELWVPSTFLIKSFRDSGVTKDIYLVPPSIDTYHWDPNNIPKFEIKGVTNDTFVFLSIFKLESRKGWDVLLNAYISEFSKTDNVALVILTYIFNESPETQRNKDRIMKIFNDHIDGSKIRKPDMPEFIIISDNLSEMQMPSLYKAANAFVIPSRGEGWGLPIQEAMTMELPVIATNYSGQTDMMKEDHSYLLSYTKLINVRPFPGEMAEPSVPHLRQLMRHVFENRKEAYVKGKKAREFIVKNFDNGVISDLLIQHLKRVETKIQKH